MQVNAQRGFHWPSHFGHQQRDPTTNLPQQWHMLVLGFMLRSRGCWVLTKSMHMQNQMLKIATPLKVQPRKVPRNRMRAALRSSSIVRYRVDPGPIFKR